jgi:hypothetical protein
MIDTTEITVARDTASDQTRRQLSALYGGAIDDGLGFILSWKGDATGMRSKFFTDVEAACRFAAARAAERCDVWTSVALYREAPPSGRGDAKSAAGLAGLFADLDAKDGAFSSKDEARRFIETAFYNVPPSMIVDSGTGIHAWFLFSEPWIFADESDRGRAAALAKRLVDSVRAAARGKTIDAVGDLARVLRLAGTTNFARGNGKDGVERPTAIIFPEADAPIRRYGVEELEAVMVDPAFVPASDASAPAPEVGYLTLAPDRPEPEIVGVLLANNERFRETWERRRVDLKDSSPSGYCMAIADALALAGATDQETADAMIAWRRAHGADLKLRQGLYQQTIAKGRQLAASRKRPDHGPLPMVIVHDGRHLREHSADALSAIRHANEPEPSVFARGGTLARVKTSDEGRIVIESLALDALRGVMERSASFVAPTKKGDYHPVPPPMDVVRDVHALPEWPGVPPLLGIVTSPRVRADGTILAKPGYDRATRLYLTEYGETVAVPDAPTGRDARRSVAEIIDGAFGDFPFVSDADRANAIAFALSIVARPAIAGPVPVAIFDARSGQGTGKSLLVRTLCLIACGSEPAMGGLPGDEEEWRKTLLALLMGGRDVATFDNATKPVESGTLANVVTSPVFEDRILGVSRRVEVPVRCIFAVTGNRITLGGDMARRCFPVELDARVERPEDREGFRHPDLIAWVRVHRSALLRALLTMARAWWVAGCPAPSVKPWGSFEDYVRVVGGILEHAGVTGFLANRQVFRELADDERAEWALFLSVLYASFGEKSFTAREVFDRVGMGEVGAIPVGALPGDLAENFTRVGTTRRIGKALARQSGRIIGGYLLEGSMDAHAKVRTFRITKGGVR